MDPSVSQPEQAAPSADSLAEANQALQDAQWAEQAGLLDKAVTEYRKVVGICPGVFEVQNNLANLLLSLGRPREALEPARAAHALKPGDPLVNANLGQALARSQMPEPAIPCLRAALAAHPAAHELREALADCLLEIGRVDEAVAVFNEVRARANDDPPLLRLMAAFYYRARRGADAEQCYLRMLELAPRRAATYNDLSQLYVDFAQFGKAREMALKGLEVEPGAAVLWNTLANSQASLGMATEALDSYRKVLELSPKLAPAHSNMLLSMHYSSEIDPRELVAEHRRWAQMHAPPEMAAREFTNTPVPGRRLRVGYLSPDIRRHSVAFFLESLLDHRSRGDFEFYCYALVKTPDEITRRLSGKFDHYQNVVDLGDREIADLIRNDQVDVLVDLAGHAGTVHAAVLAYKPAPVVVTYCGYPDTTGMTTVDYRLTDWISDPPGVEPDYTEQLVRLPNGFLCFRPPEDAPAVGQAPGLARGHATFGSFNREFKVSQKAFDLWCEILKAVPSAQMLMKSVAGADPQARAHQLGQFERRGIDPARVRLVGFLAHQRDHLASYRDVDIALDTFPYHGTTTTLDSLLMGVPVITLAGFNHASRVGVSLLTQAGLEELVATSAGDYVSKAVALALDLPRVNRLHGELRRRLLTSTLCDAPRFARNYEYALRGMWYRWCRDRGAPLTAAQAAAAEFDFTALGEQPGQAAG